MKTLVVYHSQFGNTKTLAEAVVTGLEGFGPVRVLPVDEPGAKHLDDVDLLVIGGPTQGHGISKTMHAFLAAITGRATDGIKAATFDTRLRGPEILWGSAAKATAATLQRAGLELDRKSVV